MLSHSAAETEEIGYRFGSSLRNGDCVSLTGSLGAGKTVLAKGIARALGITEPIVSPTFTLVQEYEGSGASALRFLSDADAVYDIRILCGSGKFTLRRLSREAAAAALSYFEDLHDERKLTDANQ